MIKLGSKKVFLSSDSHYAHLNICRGTSKWDGGANENNGQSCRDFDTVEEMNKALVDGVNNTVGANDVLIFCGDWSFQGIENIYHFRKQLKVKEIHLILGNHDHHIERNKAFPLSILSDEEYMKATLVKSLPTQDLFTSVQQVQTFELIHEGKKETVFCSHYSHRIWDKSHHSRIHCYGHSHGSLEAYPLGLSMDIGVDNAFRLLGEYRPFSWEEIKANLAGREPHIIDHHNSRTS